MPTLHPLVNVIDFSQCPVAEHIRFCLGFYAVFLKDVRCGDMSYGRLTYDYQEGTLVFIAPGQCVGFDNRGVKFQPKGWGLLFHPDLLRGTPLGARHPPLHLLFLRGARGAPPLGAGAAHDRGVPAQHPPRVAAAGRRPQPKTDRGQHRDAAQLLRAFLRPAVRHAQRCGGQRRAHAFRGHPRPSGSAPTPRSATACPPCSIARSGCTSRPTTSAILSSV